MEKLIIERVEFIKEETYQRIKKELNKEDDYFYKYEIKIGKKCNKKLTHF